MKPLNLPVGLALVIGMAGTFFFYIFINARNARPNGWGSYYFAQKMSPTCVLVWRHLPARWGSHLSFLAQNVNGNPSVKQLVCGADVTSSRWTPGRGNERRKKKKKTRVDDGVAIYKNPLVLPVGDHRLEPFRLRCHPPVPLFSLCAHFFSFLIFFSFGGVGLKCWKKKKK